MNTANCSYANFYAKDTFFLENFYWHVFCNSKDLELNLTPYVISATVILVSMYIKGLKMAM